ncbi:hypothetical protein EZS27_002193 [termite gut metagenome]|uniref:Helix-hairpin-helix domain-containing protein n=1 Tax=termite gut metagenome TaxID=433724 RepID=A0A5J4SW69_9ZZZZ
MWKDFFYFTRSERRGAIALVLLIFLVLASGFLFTEYREKEEVVAGTLSEKEYSGFNTRLQEKRHKPTIPYHLPKKSREIVLTPFDPNTADSIAFVCLGLSSRTAGNIIRYRAKGGVFRKPEDFKKIYGLTPEQYAELSPYISMKQLVGKKKDSVLVVKQAQEPLPIVFKYPSGTVIDLNHADTAEFKKIPGIGSGISKAIAGYRKKLGGFYSVSQLEDIHLSTAQFAEWLHVEPGNTIRINLNKVRIERLRAHPYFNFYQAKAIVEYRKKKGVLTSLKQMALYEEFSEKDLERMEHYVCFE